MTVFVVLKNQAGLTFLTGVRWAQELHTLTGVTIREDCEIGIRALLNLILSGRQGLMLYLEFERNLKPVQLHG